MAETAARASAIATAADVTSWRVSRSSCSARRRSNRDPSPSRSRVRRISIKRSTSRMWARTASSRACSATSRATAAAASARSIHSRASRSASAAAVAATPARDSAARVPNTGSDCSTCRNSVKPAPSRLYITPGFGYARRASCSRRVTSVSARMALACGPSRTIRSTTSRSVRSWAAASDGTTRPTAAIQAHTWARVGIKRSSIVRTDGRPATAPVR